MSHRSAAVPNDLRAFWMPFTANRQFKKAPRLFVGAKDMHYTTSRRATGAGRHRGPVVLQRGALPSEDHRGDRRAGGGDGLRAGVPDGASQGLRARQPGDRHRARGHGARLLRQFRLGGGGERPEDRHRLPAGNRAGLADAADRAGARLSRGQLRWHLGGRDRQQSQVLRNASGRAWIICRIPTT